MDILSLRNLRYRTTLRQLPVKIKMPKKPNTIQIKDFLDFREYLREVIGYRQKSGESITNRSFAEAVGIHSSSWLTTVLNGKKGISRKTAGAISAFLGHTTWEQGYFKLLVDFNQAKTIERRNTTFAAIKQHLLQKGYTALYVLQPDQYEFYSKWYYTAVRSLLGMFLLGDEYPHIARLLSPSITAVQAKKSIKLLTRLGLISKNDRGFYQLTGKTITTGPNVHSVAVANFQRETMRLGIEAIDRYPQTRRDISTMSVGISEEGFKKISALIADCRKAITEVADSDHLADRVYQINFQAFPLSKTISQRESS
jgi:uncharacterized protein (TIGR02147 family)